MELKEIQKAKKRMDYDLTHEILKIVSEFTHLTGLPVSGIEFDSQIHYNSIAGRKKPDMRVVLNCKGIVNL